MSDANYAGEEAADRKLAESDWSALVTRILDDLARIEHAEITRIEASLNSVAQMILNRAFIVAVALVLGSTGIASLVAAGALLLHNWLPWWQALGIVGIGATIMAELVDRVVLPILAGLHGGSAVH